ncbi:hypothetical protein NMY22_g19696 [Coprinellus aureogranulatus]|nr:hypothetical protein NMY22_g19696 [Coprinellus aureogranulatus]
MSVADSYPGWTRGKFANIAKVPRASTGSQHPEVLVGTVSSSKENKLWSRWWKKVKLVIDSTPNEPPSCVILKQRPTNIGVKFTAFSKEQREAALRARGLLPPLSLSQQERELDNSIPVVRPAEPVVEDGETKMSAADLIKQQWEAKNKEAAEKDRQRMHDFKFGSENSSPSSESKESNTDDESRSESSIPQQPSPKTSKARRRQGLHQASLSQPMLLEAEALKDLEHRRSLSVQTKGLPAVPEDAPAKLPTPVTPVLDLPTEFQLYLDEPPPPSLLKKTQPRPSSSENKVATTSVHTESTATGRRSPPRPPHSDDRPVSTSARTKDTIVAPSSAISPTDTLVNGSHERSDSLPRADSGSSSIHTPSLDGSSSTMKSSESLTNTKQGGKLVSGKSLENGISVIVETPSEGGGGAHEASFASSDKDTAIRSANDDGDEPPPVPSKGRRRGITDPPPPKHITLADAADQVLASGDVPAPTRRKTINPFKRNQQREDGTGGKISLRSVVGTVLRPRNGAAGRMTSPTRPQDQDTSVSPPNSPKKPVREAINPVVYTAGDIQAQANTIKDDEERRMAELAFMF